MKPQADICCNGGIRENKLRIKNISLQNEQISDYQEK